MHSQQWEELIPFYVAQTLSRREQQALERHLATCETCRRAVADWRKIGSAVRAEAASQLRDLPPLSPMLRAAMSGTTGQPEALRPLQPYAPPGQRANVARRVVAPLTLAAAVITVVLFGLLIVNLSQRQNPDDLQSGSSVTLGNGETTITPTPTATVDLMATIAVLSTQYADGTRANPNDTPILLNFATNTPSQPAPTATHTPEPTQTTIFINANATTPAAQPSVPVAIVTGESINLRSGPGTNYPVVGSAVRDQQLVIVARAGSGPNSWLLVQGDRGRTAWVYADIVTVNPADATIPAAATIPPVPPTETPLPTSTPQPPTPVPTSAMFIRGGSWAHVMTVVEHQCGGEINVSTSADLILVPSADLSSVSFTYLGSAISFTVFRTTGMSYSGAYNIPDVALGGSATVSVQVTFDNNGSTYTGQETVLHPDSCIVRSLWAGHALN